MTHFPQTVRGVVVLGQEIADEDGWRIVVAAEDDGVWTMDKHGAEHFESAWRVDA